MNGPRLDRYESVHDYREGSAVSLSRAYSRERISRIGALVLGSTLALTMSFFGIVALSTGAAGGVLDRLPYYVLVAAAAFVGTVVLLEEWALDGETVLRMAGIVTVAAFLLVGLATEGSIYVATYPSEVMASHLFVYVLSAGMAASGIGFWTARHYRELRSRSRSKKIDGRL